MRRIEKSLVDGAETSPARLLLPQGQRVTFQFLLITSLERPCFWQQANQ